MKVDSVFGVFGRLTRTSLNIFYCQIYTATVLTTLVTTLPLRTRTKIRLLPACELGAYNLGYKTG